MIYPSRPQTSADVAAHYDRLDQFYRDVWGEHVHHGFWAAGKETPPEAAAALTALVADRLAPAPGGSLCDIGCGYGASAQILAERFGANVTGFTLSETQAALGAARRPNPGGLAIRCADWLANGLADQIFDHAYAIESSEHMTDKPRFFSEAFRTLKPGGRLVVCAWLAADRPSPWEVRHLLEPICREGRLPGMGNEAEYRALGQACGFSVAGFDDISRQVSRTWRLCAWRLFKLAFTDARVIKTLRDAGNPDRVFAVTLLRLIAAYRTGAMRYGVFVYQKP